VTGFVVVEPRGRGGAALAIPHASTVTAVLVLRALLVGLIVVGLVPAAAGAATVSREGSQIVFRSAPGESDWFAVDGGKRQGRVRFYDVSGDAAVVDPGAGCTHEGVRENVFPSSSPPPVADAVCDAAGATIVRILTGDGDDHVSVAGNLPVAVDLGPGDDGLVTSTGEELRYSIGLVLDSYDLPSATVTGGDGDDSIDLLARAASVRGEQGDDRLIGKQLQNPGGRWRMDGGAGDDTLFVRTKAARARLRGGAGDDLLDSRDRTADRVDCGPGQDVATLDRHDRPNRSC
jgi:Ca2+-binding RTX toxin-like protein